jgi:hypothetical protein
LRTKSVNNQRPEPNPFRGSELFAVYYMVIPIILKPAPQTPMAALPQAKLAGDMRAQNVDIGRTFPPYTNWARITIGLPDESRTAQQKLREILPANRS